MRTTIPLFAALALGGCARAPAPSAEPALPDVAFRDLEVDALGFERLDAELHLTLSNPYPFAVDMAGLAWDLELAGAQILAGQGPGATIPAHTTAVLAVPVSLTWSEVLPALRATGHRDHMPWALDGVASFETPTARVGVPFTASGSLPALHPPELSLREVVLRDLDLRNGLAEVDIPIEVASREPLQVESLSYALAVDGAPVSEGVTAVEQTDDRLVLTAALDLNELDETVRDAFATGGAVELHLEATATVDTVHGRVPLEIDLQDLVPIAELTRL